MRKFGIKELFGEAYNEAMRQIVIRHSTFGYQFDPKRDWYELEAWATDVGLEFDENGNMI